MWSLPTRESIADLSPSRAQPNAIFADDPPRYFAKLDTSSSRAPTCCAYKSTASRPRQTTSRVLADAKRVPVDERNSNLDPVFLITATPAACLEPARLAAHASVAASRHRPPSGRALHSW